MENYKIKLYVTIILILIVVPLFIKQYKSKFKLDLYYGEIFLDGEDKKLKTFIDTGNNLITCYDEPVIILSNEHQLIKREDVKNLRRVSYKTINEKEVVVNGIRIEKIIMEYRNEMYINEAVLIESNVKFDGYDAIIGLEFFERAQKISKKERENTNGYFIVNKSKG